MDPWYRATTPCREVREARSFNPDEFAIALEQVVAGTAPVDYHDADWFFARTYFAAAMLEQIGMMLRRLAGETEGAPPVLSFITQFGGGKTHTLTALWHLAGVGPEAARLPGVPELLACERLPTVPRAKRGVFVGDAWDPWRRAPDTVARSRVATWGRGRDHHAWRRRAHQLARHRGADPLVRSCRRPVLILMDEALNFINRHRS